MAKQLTPDQRLRDWSARFAAAVELRVSKTDKRAPYDTYADLCKVVEVQPCTMSLIINGRVPHLTTFARICAACKMKPEEVGKLVLQLGQIA